MIGHIITSFRPHSTTWEKEGQDDIQKEGVRGWLTSSMPQDLGYFQSYFSAAFIL
nr:MAG TPA: hypothetical protein [Caudoviricetes sp.]